MVYQEAQILENIIGILILGIIFLVIIAICLGRNRGTKNYKHDLSNLYVAGKIRQIATKDGIDLGKEYELYKKFIKKQNMQEMNLSETIEDELKERITEGIEKKEK